MGNEIGVTRDQLQPGSFLNKREEPGNEVAKAIPATTAALLQRYALFLSGFDYEIEHRSSTQHCNADGLSRLPLATTEDEENQSVDPVEAFHVSQFSMLPVTFQHVRKATQRDSTLAQVYEHVTKG